VEDTEVVGGQSLLQHARHAKQQQGGSGGGTHHGIHGFLAKGTYFSGDSEGSLLLAVGCILQCASSQLHEYIGGKKAVRSQTHRAGILSPSRNSRSTAAGSESDTERSGATGWAAFASVNGRRLRTGIAGCFLAGSESDAEGLGRASLRSRGCFAAVSHGHLRHGSSGFISGGAFLCAVLVHPLLFVLLLTEALAVVALGLEQLDEVRLAVPADCD